jgi:hypothetical protein
MPDVLDQGCAAELAPQARDVTVDRTGGDRLEVALADGPVEVGLGEGATGSLASAERTPYSLPDSAIVSPARQTTWALRSMCSSPTVRAHAAIGRDDGVGIGAPDALGMGGQLRDAGCEPLRGARRGGDRNALHRCSSFGRARRAGEPIPD